MPCFIHSQQVPSTSPVCISCGPRVRVKDLLDRTPSRLCLLSTIPHVSLPDQHIPLGMHVASDRLWFDKIRTVQSKSGAFTDAHRSYSLEKHARRYIRYRLKRCKYRVLGRSCGRAAAARLKVTFPGALSRMRAFIGNKCPFVS